MPRATGFRRPLRIVALAALGVALCSGGLATPSGAAAYPPLSDPGRAFLENLSLPSVAPGGSATLSFVVADPEPFGLSGVVVTFAVYAFNGYPGDAAAPLPSAAPTLDNGSASGPEVNVTIGAVASGATFSGSVRLATSSATPSGTFAVRTALAFVGNSTSYRLESRGWFSLGEWENATRGPNGSATVNLTELGVSGVVPETALLVSPSYWPVVLGVLVAVGVVLVGAGAFVYFRRTSPGSTSGAG